MVSPAASLPKSTDANQPFATNQLGFTLKTQLTNLGLSNRGTNSGSVATLNQDDKPMYRMILILAGLLLLNCAPQQKCRATKHYLKKVDISKPFKVEGKYCIVEERDTLIGGSRGAIRLNIYSRLSGQKIAGGSVWFGENSRNTFFDGFFEATLSVGSYNINVYPNESHYPFGVKDLMVSENKLVIINCFVGDIKQF